MNTSANNIYDYNNFTYSTLGEATSAKSHSRRIKDCKIPNYKVYEKYNKNLFSKKIKIANILKTTTSYFPIPGLSKTNILGKTCNTMVPQGICPCESYVLITAYDSCKIHNSVIYVLENNQIIATLIYDKKAHMGGICYDGSYIWIAEGGGSAHGNEISYIDKNNFFKTINVAISLKAKSIALQGITPLRADNLKYTSFCSFYDNLLWIGSFCADKSSHIYGYSIEKNNEEISLKPVTHIDAPAKSQGICFYKNESFTYLCVSTSYGRLHNSVFKCYKLEDYHISSNKHNDIKLLHIGNTYKTLTLPPMSEQINIKNSSIYCIFESGATKYIKTSSRPIGSYCIFDANKIFL